MTKTFDYEEEAGELGKHHAGTSDTGQFWGDQGAGVLPLAKSTGRILLSLRSPYVNEPNTWGIVGGAIDKNENPKTAALRELQEELGNIIILLASSQTNLKSQPIGKIKTQNGLTWKTYLLLSTLALKNLYQIATI